MVQSINPDQTYPLTTWDTVILDLLDSETQTSFDWAIDEGPGMVAEASLHTAVLLCLFTDRRAPEDFDLPHDGDDRRGWWGDYVDIEEESFEREMGSLIWLYERNIVSEEIAERIKYEAIDALQVLILQGLCARVDVDHDYFPQSGMVTLDVRLYSQDGQLRYSQKFHRNWLQAHSELS